MIYKEKEFLLKNGLKVILKTPLADEAKEVLDFIVSACGQTDYLLSSPEDKIINVEDEVRWINNMINSKNYFIVAMANGKIIGDCNLNFGTHVKDKHRASIGIAIDKEYWNIGLGSLLFDELINLAQNTEGVEQIDLGVNSSNQRAIHLYEKKGFKKTGSIPNALKLKDGSYYDEILMTKFL